MSEESLRQQVESLQAEVERLTAKLDDCNKWWSEQWENDVRPLQAALASREGAIVGLVKALRDAQSAMWDSDSSYHGNGSAGLFDEITEQISKLLADPLASEAAQDYEAMRADAEKRRKRCEFTNVHDFAGQTTCSTCGKTAEMLASEGETDYERLKGIAEAAREALPMMGHLSNCEIFAKEGGRTVLEPESCNCPNKRLRALLGGSEGKEACETCGGTGIYYVDSKMPGMPCPAGCEPTPTEASS